MEALEKLLIKYQYTARDFIEASEVLGDLIKLHKELTQNKEESILSYVNEIVKELKDSTELPKNNVFDNIDKILKGE